MKRVRNHLPPSEATHYRYGPRGTGLKSQDSFGLYLPRHFRTFGTYLHRHLFGSPSRFSHLSLSQTANEEGTSASGPVHYPTIADEDTFLARP
jgi:hypothetical protein